MKSGPRCLPDALSEGIKELRPDPISPGGGPGDDPRPSEGGEVMAMNACVGWFVRTGLLLGCTLGCLAEGGEAQREDPPPVRRVLSLRQLQHTLEGSAAGSPASQEAHLLGGLTSVDGFMVDSAEHDVILIGRVDPRAPSCHVDDLTVALRNVWGLYAEDDAHKQRLTPGCSLEPDEDSNAELAHLADRVRAADSSAAALLIEEWTARCRRLQRVDIWGIPRQTRFAAAMLQADYEMKALVDGTDHLELGGFYSLHDTTMNEARSGASRGERISAGPRQVNRFWFHPGEVGVSSGADLLLISACRVALLTEARHIAVESGIGTPGREGRADAALPRPESERLSAASDLAQAFAAQFTRRYAEIAVERPVFAELGQLFRLVLLAELLHAGDSFSVAGLDPGFLLRQYELQPAVLPDALPGRPRISAIRQRGEFDGQSGVLTVRLMSCGGVAIRFDLTQVTAVSDSSGDLENLRRAILASREGAQDLSWRIDTPE